MLQFKMINLVDKQTMNSRVEMWCYKGLNFSQKKDRKETLQTKFLATNFNCFVKISNYYESGFFIEESRKVLNPPCSCKENLTKH